MTLTPEVVHAAAADWIWVPDVAERHETEEYLVLQFPAWFESELELVAFRPTRPLDVVVAEVLERAAATTVPQLRWWVMLGAPDGTDAAVVEAGGVLVETLDVLALDLTGGLPDLAAPEADLVWVADAVVMHDAHEVGSDVFGGSVPPDHQVDVEAEEARADHAEGRGGQVVAYVDDVAVGTAGLSLVDGVARLWGAAVRPEHRGTGLYRALLDARLRYAVAHAASMALVRGRVETSGPILRRAGFEVFGQQRGYRVPLSPSPDDAATAF